MISIIIYNFNGIEDLKKNLSHNMNLWKEEGINDIIIIDDNSSDSSIHYIKTHFPAILVLSHERTQFIASTYNRATEEAKHSLLLFTHSTIKLHSFNRKELLNLYKDKNLFALHIKQLVTTKKGTIQQVIPTYTFINGWVKIIHRLEKPSKTGIKNKSTFLYAPSAGMIVNKEKLIQLNGFDPHYDPIYFEDIDVCYRAWQRQWKTLYTDYAILFTNEEYPLLKFYSKKFSLQTKLKNSYLFYWKNITHKRMLTFHIIGIFFKILFFQINHVRAILKGVLLIPNIISHRKNNQTLYSAKEIITLTKY